MINASLVIMMTFLRAASLLAATLSMGYVASVFSCYASVIMPGLRRTDDRTFVTGFQRLDAAITRPLFLVFGFLGALLFTGLAGLLQLGADPRPALPWIVAAFVLYLVAFVITIAVHVPLNNGIRDAGDPARIADLAAVRAAFREATWVGWNRVRSVVAMIAFGCLTWALVEFGRALGQAG